MAKRKRKLSIPGMIIIGLIFVLVVFLLVLLMKYFFLDRNKTEYKDKPNKDKVVEKEENPVKLEYEITSNSYVVYTAPDLDYGFVLADFDFNNKSMEYSIDKFVTSENIKLSDVEKYIKFAEERGIYARMADIVTVLPKEGTYTAKLFIPFTNLKAQSIKLTYDNEVEFEFDLSKNAGDLKDLQYEMEEIVTDDETFEIQVTGVTDLTGTSYEMFGELFTSGSNMELYALNVNVKPLNKEPVYIISAKFVDKDGNVYESMGDGVKTYQVQNIVGYECEKETNGAILFEMFNPVDASKTLYYGQLILQLNSCKEDYIIKVSLN